MKTPFADRRDRMELSMTPMIDVVFLLLVFFVWTSSFEIPEFDLPSAIAQPPDGRSEIQSEAESVEPFDEIVVRLMIRDATPMIEFNGEFVADVRVLKSTLQAIIAIGVQPPVIIDPDDEVTMNFAVKVYDAARAAGADRVLFAADSVP